MEHVQSPRDQRTRRLFLLIVTVSCVWLAPWIGYLVLTLPSHYEARHWRGVWVGFDIALLAAFCWTAWSGWRRRQMVILAAVVTGTLLLCDAWFDLALDFGTSAFWMSLASALLGELPLAALLYYGATRLLRATLRHAWRALNPGEPVPPLHRLGILALPAAAWPGSRPPDRSPRDRSPRDRNQRDRNRREQGPPERS